MKTIIHVVDVNAPSGKVYTAVTTAKGLAGRWTSMVTVEERAGALGI